MRLNEDHRLMEVINEKTTKDKKEKMRYNAAVLFSRKVAVRKETG